MSAFSNITTPKAVALAKQLLKNRAAEPQELYEHKSIATYPTSAPIRPLSKRGKVRPGKLVVWEPQRDTTFGVVVAIANDEITVVWSKCPVNADGFRKFTFPLVRRVFPRMIANQLINVQPMSLPTNLVFFHDFTTSGSVSP